jgi:DNA (cytosine-5)-methyltransferase 1
MYENHSSDSRITGPVDPSPTVRARWGTGGGNTPLVQHTFSKSTRPRCKDGEETWVDDGIANTLNCFDIGDIQSTNLAVQPFVFQQNVREEVRLINGDGQITGALSAESGMHQQNFIAQPIALAENTIGRQPMNGGNGDEYTVGGPMYTLNATGVHGVAHPDHSMAVRRLTPTESERLQGFPDGWTDILTDTPDGPRYKALGNSMAVPVMRWIGERINEHR